MSNSSLTSLGVAESRIYGGQAHQRLEIGGQRGHGASYTPVKDEDSVISTFNVLQDLLDLGKVGGFHDGSVLERRQVELGWVLEELKAMLVQRKTANLVSDVVKGALLRLELEIGCPLVWSIGVDGDKKLEWLLPGIQGQLLEVVDVAVNSSACHGKRSSDDIRVG